MNPQRSTSLTSRAKRSQPLDAPATREQRSHAVYPARFTATGGRRPLLRRRCGSIHVGNPKANRPAYLRAVHGLRLPSQNAAHEITFSKSIRRRNRMVSSGGFLESRRAKQTRICQNFSSYRRQNLYIRFCTYCSAQHIQRFVGRFDDDCSKHVLSPLLLTEPASPAVARQTFKGEMMKKQCV